MKDKFLVRNSRIEGKGAFASQVIRKGEVICTMKGEKISIPELKRRYDLGEERICDPLQISERRYLDMFSPYIYINHSCDPNAAMIETSTLIALKNITKGEEIVFDYSTTEWTWEKFGKYKEWTMECSCGSDNCRKSIVQFPLLPQKIRLTYLALEAVPAFILRKAEKKK